MNSRNVTGYDAEGGRRGLSTCRLKVWRCRNCGSEPSRDFRDAILDIKGAQRLTHTRLLHTRPPSHRRLNDTRCRRMTTMDPLAAVALARYTAAALTAAAASICAISAERKRRFDSKRVFCDEKHNANPFPRPHETRRKFLDRITVIRYELDLLFEEGLTSVVDGFGGPSGYTLPSLDFSTDWTYWSTAMPPSYPVATFACSQREIEPAPPTGSVGRPYLVLLPSTVIGYGCLTGTFYTGQTTSHAQSPYNYQKSAQPNDQRSQGILCSFPEVQAIAERPPTTSNIIQQTNAHHPQTHRHGRQFQPFGPQEWKANLQTTKTSIGSIISPYRKTQFNHNQKATFRQCSPQSISTTFRFNNKTFATQTNHLNSKRRSHNRNKRFQQLPISMIYIENFSPGSLNKLPKICGVKSRRSPTQQRSLRHLKNLSSHSSPHLANLLEKRRAAATPHPPIHSDSDSPQSNSWIAMLGQVSRTLDSLLRPPPPTNPLLQIL